eukprot:Nk52_evm9s294 gene=Nk52_evmTU9s294
MPNACGKSAVESSSRLGAEEIFSQIKSSCEHALAHSCDVVSVNEDALRRFVESKILCVGKSEKCKNGEKEAGLSHGSNEGEKENQSSSSGEFTFEKAQEFLGSLSSLPLRFETFDAECNFICVQSLLEFGSGFRHELHAATGRGAHETMLYGVIAMHLSGSKLDNGFLQNVSAADVGQYFNLPMTVSKEVVTGMYQDVPSPLVELMDRIANTLRQTGRVLDHLGCFSFAEFISLTFRDPETNALPSEKDMGEVSKRFCATLVTALANNFPGFADIDNFGGRKVYILKKAQLLVSELIGKIMARKQQRGITEETELEQFLMSLDLDHSDVNDMTVFADNVLPTVLEECGVLEYSEKIKEGISHSKVYKASEQVDLQLRAAAVAACNRIVNEASEAAGCECTSRQLDYFLWKLGKEPAYRGLERHITKDTTFY